MRARYSTQSAWEDTKEIASLMEGGAELDPSLWLGPSHGVLGDGGDLSIRRRKKKAWPFLLGWWLVKMAHLV